MTPPPIWTPAARVEGVPTLHDFAAIWQRENTPQWKPSHQRTVDGCLRFWILPSLGARSLDAVDRADLLAFRAWMHAHARRPSPARVNKVMFILLAVLREGAQRYDYPNPGVMVSALRVVDAEIDPFTLPQMTQILDALAPPWDDYFATRFYTGLRTGEIDGLCWDSVYLDDALLVVRRSWVDGAWETPKTQAGRRDVVLAPPAVDALRRQYCRTRSAGDLVFCSRTGTALNRRNVTRRVWYPVLDQLGLSRRRAYQTRHTYATLMLAAGENAEFIRRQLGHRDTQMLFQRYSRYVPNLTRQDGSAFSALLRSHDAVASCE